MFLGAQLVFAYVTKKAVAGRVLGNQIQRWICVLVLLVDGCDEVPLVVKALLGYD